MPLIFVFTVEGRRPERADVQQAEVCVRPAARLGAGRSEGELTLVRVLLA